MKKTLVAMIVFALALTVQGSAASATDYSGPDAKDGVFSADGVVTSGEKITFQFKDLLDGAVIQVVLVYPNGDTVVLDEVTVGGAAVAVLANSTVPSGGSGSISFNLPASLADGVYRIEIRSTSASGNAYTSDVTFTLGQQLGGSQGTLAITGSNTPSLVGAATLLTLLGAGFVLVSRRKETDEADLISLR